MRRIVGWLSIVLAVVTMTTPALAKTAPYSDADACAALKQARSPSWKVIDAEFVPREFIVDPPAREPTKTTVPFCRIVGSASPVSGSEIGFEAWLPPRTMWNHRFQGVGTGGSFGRIEYGDLNAALLRGYAAAATDNGHRSSGYEVNWAYQQPQRIIDFAYRAQHEVTLAGKALTRKYYRRSARYAYFVGCSQGGHHALMEAQRYPDDYDGILAGAPVYSWINEMSEQAWNAQALSRTPAGALSPAKLALLYKAVLQACGAPDGLVDEPNQCRFDPASLDCSTASSAACLTDTEVDAVRRIYAGPVTSKGVRIYPGLSPGGETAWERLWSDPAQLGGSWLGVFRYMVYDNPQWQLADIDFDRGPAFAKTKLGSILDPDDADLNRFARRKGKLIVYHGWADGMVPSQSSVDYFNAVNKQLGAARVQSFYRLYMVPGMAHCGGGPGNVEVLRSKYADDIPLNAEHDLVTALERWVERGRAPAKFYASSVNDQTKVIRTRLVCSYPAVAKYRGAGDVMSAENYVCQTIRH